MSTSRSPTSSAPSETSGRAKGSGSAPDFFAPPFFLTPFLPMASRPRGGAEGCAGDPPSAGPKRGFGLGEDFGVREIADQYDTRVCDLRRVDKLVLRRPCASTSTRALLNHTRSKASRAKRPSRGCLKLASPLPTSTTMSTTAMMSTAPALRLAAATNGTRKRASAVKPLRAFKVRAARERSPARARCAMREYHARHARPRVRHRAARVSIPSPLFRVRADVPRRRATVVAPVPTPTLPGARRPPRPPRRRR